MQKVVGPVAVIVAAGAVSTVTTAIVNDVQPDALVTLYLIVSLPEAMPFTTPVADTVAIAVLLELHTPPVVASAKVVVLPGHTVSVPVIAATVVGADTATVCVAVAVPQALVMV